MNTAQVWTVALQRGLGMLHRMNWRELGQAIAALAVLGMLFMPRRARKGRESRWQIPGFCWGLDRKLRAALLKKKFGASTYLGVKNGLKSVVLPSSARESHMQIVGPTRSGKSQLILAITAQDMAKNMPVFFMEAKGDRMDFDQYLQAAELTGRLGEVRYFNPQDPRSMTFNPIRMVPGQDPTALANQIARAIGREPSSTGQGKDYYDHQDYAKIQNMAEIFCRIGLEFTLRDAFYYFGSPEGRAKAFELCDDRKLVAIAAAEFKENDDTTALTAMIRPWISGRLGDLLNSYNPQIRIEDIFESDRLAYFAIPVGHLQLLANPLGRMVIAALIDMSSWRQQMSPKPKAGSVILDEFAQFATPSFKAFVETVGSAKLWTILSHQTLNQLLRVQGTDPTDFKSSVFDNTSGCKVIFRTPNPEDAEFWASTMGTCQSYEDTEQVVKTFMGERKTGAASRRIVERFKIHPNRLKNLKSGVAMVFSPGREDCLAKMARAHRVLGDSVPELPMVANGDKPGLNLAATVPDPVLIGKNQTHNRVSA